MTYEEHLCAWNETSKSALKQARMSNHEATSSPGMIPFWEAIQGAANLHYRNLRVKNWDTNDTMSAAIDDDKNHLSHEAPADNMRLTRYARESRLGMVNHAVALTGMNLILWDEHEKPSDTTAINLKRLICKLLSPSSDELSLSCLEISMDRAHWTWNVLVMLALVGAHAFGTIKRRVWFPFTCGQTLKK